MRNHKYRAWHAGYGESASTPPMMLFDTDAGDCLRWKSECQPVIVMQYTGLNDSKGIEIYEGDVVSFRQPMSVCVVSVDRGLMVGEVVWNNDRAGYVIGIRSGFFDFEYALCLKVIGNKFENPELIP